MSRIDGSTEIVDYDELSAGDASRVIAALLERLGLVVAKSDYSGDISLMTKQEADKAIAEYDRERERWR